MRAALISGASAVKFSNVTVQVAQPVYVTPLADEEVASDDHAKVNGTDYDYHAKVNGTDYDYHAKVNGTEYCANDTNTTDYAPWRFYEEGGIQDVPMYVHEATIMGGSHTGSKDDNVVYHIGTSPPSQFDWRTYHSMKPHGHSMKEILGEARSQGQCGSCYAFAAIQTMEVAILAFSQDDGRSKPNHERIFNDAIRTRADSKKWNGGGNWLSVEYAIECYGYANPSHQICGGSGGCGGGAPQEVFEYATKYRMPVANKKHYDRSKKDAKIIYDRSKSTADKRCSFTNWNNVIPKLRGWRAVAPNDAEAMKSALYHNGLIATSMDASYDHKTGIYKAFPGMPSYKTGIVECNHYDGMSRNHVVTVIGYGKCGSNSASWPTTAGHRACTEQKHRGMEYWTVRNSWGTGWGDNGHFHLRHDKNYKHNCGHTTHQMAGDYSRCHNLYKFPGPGGSSQGNIPICGHCGILAQAFYPVVYTRNKPKPKH